MIIVENVNKSFGENLVLDNINVKLNPGKCNLIIGESGSGKTVLLKSIVGLLDVDSGKINYNERDFVSMSRKEKMALRKEMGMLFQGGALFDSMSVQENIMFPLNMFTRETYKTKLRIVNTCLDRVGLKEVNNSSPSELSGGMKKRAAIARAISISPKYLLCDEPNSGLDPITSIRIDNLIKDITVEYNITTVINSHDMNSVLEIGDNVYFIHQGKLHWEGTKSDILHSDNTTLNDFVFATSMAKEIRNIQMK